MSLTWTTQEGKVLEPHEFEDKHLINTIRFIERRAEHLKNRAEMECLDALMFLQGEMATYYAERDADMFDKMTPREYLDSYMPIYRALCMEAKRRSLAWEPAF